MSSSSHSHAVKRAIATTKAAPAATTTVDKGRRGEHRIRFVKPTKRAKLASARWTTTATTTTAARASADSGRKKEKDGGEPDVDGPCDDDSSSKQRADDSGEASPSSASSSQFAVELDLALERNGSEEFEAFYRKVWPLSRSLPELLHHSSAIVDALLTGLTTATTTIADTTATEASSDKDGSVAASGGDNDEDEGDGGNNSEEADEETEERVSTEAAAAAVVASAAATTNARTNLATLDLLTLLGALSRDLRHEIHPFVHTRIFPRLLVDLMAWVAAPDSQRNAGISGGGGGGPVDATALVEAAFRAAVEVMRSDSALLLAEEGPVRKDQQHTGGTCCGKKPRNAPPCLEKMRSYYGGTLAHPRPAVRRLAAEAFAGLVRRLPPQAAKLHLSRVLRALRRQAAQALASLRGLASSPDDDAVGSARRRQRNKKRQLLENAADGIALLLWNVARGAPGTLHSKLGKLALDVVLQSVVAVSPAEEAATASADELKEDSPGANSPLSRDASGTFCLVAPPTPATLQAAGDVATRFVGHMCRHLAFLPVAPRSSNLAYAATTSESGRGGTGDQRNASAVAIAQDALRKIVRLAASSSSCQLSSSSSTPASASLQPLSPPRSSGTTESSTSSLRQAASTACLLHLAQQLLDFQGGRLLFPERRHYDNDETPGLVWAHGSHEEDTDDHYNRRRQKTMAVEDGAVMDELLDLVGRLLLFLPSEGSQRTAEAATRSGRSVIPSAAVQVLGSAWIALERNLDGGALRSRRKRIHDLLRSALCPRIGSGSVEEGAVNAAVELVVFLSQWVVRDLLARLPDGEAAMSTLGSILLSTASSLLLEPFGAGSEARRLVHSVVVATGQVRRRVLPSPTSMLSSSSSPLPEDSDRCFDLCLARYASVTGGERDRLLRSFLFPKLTSGHASSRTASLSSSSGSSSSADDYNELAERVLSAAFCALVSTTDTLNSAKRQNQGAASPTDECLDWLLQLGEALMQEERVPSDTSLGGNGNGECCRWRVILSIIVECAAALAPHSLPPTRSASTPSRCRQAVARLQRLAERHLLASSSSPLAVKSVAAVVQVLSRIDVMISTDADAFFEALVPNLCHKNHFLRLRSIEVLASLPPRPYVRDHASLDLSGDLEEEPSVGYLVGQGQKESPETGTLDGMSEVLNLLLSIETTGLSLHEERSLLSKIGRVGVLGRTGRLPVAHAEAAASHLLGMLHSKFAPVWPAVVQALAALAKGHEDCAWPWIHRTLTELTGSVDEEESAGRRSAGLGNSDPTLYELCIAWEEDGDQGLFQTDLDSAKENGVVSRHESTDPFTVFESSWAVLEKAPWLITKHSRSVVELFLRFMHEQYYGGKLEDPDARELNLSKHLGDSNRTMCNKVLEKLGGQRRLIAILKAFSVVKGPQQLSMHGHLRSVFTSLIGHSEASVGCLAFACLLRFNDASIRPYAVDLQQLFLKGKLRGALLHLQSLAESDAMPVEHRHLLMPTLSRILFGRLSSRAVSKSSKDSPAARRSAVLAFLNCFCQDDAQLSPFLYLMTRGYLPQEHECVAVELQASSHISDALNQIRCITIEQVRSLSPAKHQGFLNMMEAVLDQLGHRITKWIPAFLSVVVAIAQAYEIKPSFAAAAGEISGDDATLIRSGTIRALCFRRLAEVLDRFHEMIDFCSLADGVWQSIRGSVPLLPEMTANSTGIPSVLRCLASLTGHDAYVEFLSAHDVFPSFLRCISAKSSHAVVDLVLESIENLIGRTDNDAGTGPHLVKQNIYLLLSQLHERLDSKSQPGEHSTYDRKLGSTSQSWKRELRILSRVSQLLGSNTKHDVDRGVMNALCRVLVPFLERRRINETEQLNVLSVLNSITPRLERSDAVQYYVRLSKLLGLGDRARPKVSSKEVRRSISLALQCVAKSAYGVGTKCAAMAVSLCAVHATRVDELDYDQVLSTLGNLSEAQQWTSLCASAGTGADEPSVLLPTIYACFTLLYDSDGVAVRSSVKALKALVAASTRMSRVTEDDSVRSDDVTAKNWIKLLQGSVVSTTREGLRSRDESVRRFFVSIMRSIAIHCSGSASPHLYGDLIKLVREDDPDLDFFLNITHVQIHRQARALLRLRKALNGDEELSGGFTTHSLSNILLPLAVHPVYESKTRDDDNVAIEAIATVGAIARRLPFSKYSTLLSTTLSQFHGNLKQERYAVSLLCAVIDAFHFQTQEDLPSSDSKSACASAAMRSLESRIIPKVEGLLVKEKVDQHGERTKVLRPSVALALLKLFQKLPEDIFRTKLPRLLTVVCDVLKSRDSDVRDAARTTLAKMVVSMDLVFLPDVIRELALSLTEGYRLHVRAATIHSILLALSSSLNHAEMTAYTSRVEFDRSVPGLMDLLQQDLFGETQERREAEGNHVRFVKEASGSKSFHSLEMIATMIRFEASDSTSPSGHFSCVRALVAPFLERLRNPAIGASTIRKIRECLVRVVNGLSRNPSVILDQVLGLVHATISPLILQSDLDYIVDDNNEDDDGEGIGSYKPITVSGGIKAAPTSKHDSAATPRVAEWQPSLLGAPRDAKSARKMKTRAEEELSKVYDGRAAPKLTGSHRVPMVRVESSINSPSSVSAVVFGLQLLSGTLRKSKPDRIEELKAKLDSFVVLLTACVCVAKDQDVLALGLKCLNQFLRVDLPSVPRCARSLAAKCLDFLTCLCSSSTHSHETVQHSFKLLSCLLDLDRKAANLRLLSTEQMQVLLSLLRSSILELEQPTAAMNLIKTIVSLNHASTELYDLMETMLEQSVRSSRASLRQQCSSIFVLYLLDYPLSPARVEQHLKQIVLNLKYEHAEGRMAAISLLSAVIDKVPMPFLVQHAQLFFLPLTLQLVNDDSEECRQAVSRAISSLVERLPYESQGSLCDHVVRWSSSGGGANDEGLWRTSLQLSGILLRSCPDALKRRGLSPVMLDNAERAIVNARQLGWEVPYFALAFLEKALESPLCHDDVLHQERRHDLWMGLFSCLRHNHPWIRLVSVRVLAYQLSDLDGTPSSSSSSLGPLLSCLGTSFWAGRLGSLHEATRGLCYQLAWDGDGASPQSDEAATLATKSLALLLPLLDRCPELWISPKDDDAKLLATGSSAPASDDSDDDDERLLHVHVTNPDPVAWVLKRLASAAKQKSSPRRQRVFRCLAAMAAACPNIVRKHLELVLEPLHRSELEMQNHELGESSAYRLHKRARRGDSSTAMAQTSRSSSTQEEAQLAKSVLQVVEELCCASCPEEFLRAYAAVKSRAQEKKEGRKLRLKAEAIRDPQAFAARRIRKQEREKGRRKRRNEESRKDHHGGIAAGKKRHFGVV